LRPHRVRRPPDVPLVQPRTRCSLVQAAVEFVLGRHMRLVPPLRRPFRVPECIPLVAESTRHAHPRHPVSNADVVADVVADVAASSTGLGPGPTISHKAHESK
jgi:hypothetical protein